MIVGGGTAGAELIRALEASPETDIRICGVFDDRGDGRVARTVGGYPLLGNVDELVEFGRNSRVDLLIVTLPIAAESRLLQLFKKLWVLPVDIRLSAHSNTLRFRPRTYSYIGNVPFIDVLDRPIADWDFVAKWIFDKTVALARIVLLLPLFLLIALAVKLDSRGPVLFRQKRYGFNNERIDVYKFRSIYVDQTDHRASKLVTKNDPRVTRVGRFIRRTSLDELPQLFNVLKGELSLVGPRPHADQLYHDVVDGYYARHRVKPGITGWAQVNGWRGETDTSEKIHRRVEHDLYYIESTAVLHDARDGAAISRSGLRTLGHLFVWITVLSGFLVQKEPAPYDFLIVAAAAMYLLCGMVIPRRITGLIVLIAGLIAGGVLSLTRVPEYDPFFFHLVTAYLGITAIFFAAFIAGDPGRRLPLVMNAYLCAALIASALGVAGYFGVGGEILTRYGGRAMATFKDPNVFGAFLIAPGAYAFMLALTRPIWQSMLAIGAYSVLGLGILLSFSRAAWIGLVLASALVALFSFVTGASNRERTRLIVIVLSAVPILLLAVAFALSMDGVKEIVDNRTSLQEYDTGQGGRFYGQVVGFSIAVENPLGLGPFEFAKRWGADPHNVYLNALLSYGWLGALSYYLITGLTLFFAFRAGLRRSRWRTYAIPIAASFIVIAAEGIIIDSDHWRHYFLLVGLVWGLHAASGDRLPAPYLRRSTGMGGERPIPINAEHARA